jgi:hypothetical protein
MDRREHGEHHHQQEACDEDQAEPWQKASWRDGGDPEAVRVYAIAPRASTSRSSSVADRAWAVSRVASKRCCTFMRWGVWLRVCWRTVSRSSHFHWGSRSGFEFIYSSIDWGRRARFPRQDDAGKTISISSMEVSFLPQELHRCTAARDPELPSGLREMRFDRRRGEAESFRDLTGLQVVRDALQASPFLTGEARGRRLLLLRAFVRVGR